MSTVHDLVDQPSAPEQEARREWDTAMEYSLTTEPEAWLAVARNDLTTARAWRLLNYPEAVATLVVREGRMALAETAAFALAILDNEVLDTRELVLVASLLRRGCELAGVDYLRAVRAGCRRAGPSGQDARHWLEQVVDRTPSTHEEVGAGTTFAFRRLPSTVDVARLEEWWGETN